MVDYPDHERGIRLIGSDITLDIRIEASDVDLNMIFTDQSAAVFDAAKWFAHQAEHVYVHGSVEVPDNLYEEASSRVVPAGTTFFITGIGYGIQAEDAGPEAMIAWLGVGPAIIFSCGSVAGGVAILDVPVRATAEVTVRLFVAQYRSGSAQWCNGGFWGYDEVP